MNPSRALARPTTLTATPYRPASRSACESSARTSHRPTVPKPTSQTAAASPRGREVSHTSKRDRPAHRRTGQTPAAFARTDSNAKTRAPQTPHGAPRQEGSSLQRGASVSAAPARYRNGRPPSVRAEARPPSARGTKQEPCAPGANRVQRLATVLAPLLRGTPLGAVKHSLLVAIWHMLSTGGALARPRPERLHHLGDLGV